MSFIYLVQIGKGWEGQTFTIESSNKNRLLEWINNNENIYDEMVDGEISDYLIARNVTQLQTRKFENFITDYKIITRKLVFDYFHYSGVLPAHRRFIKERGVDFRVKEHFDDEVLKELEVAKYNPRNPLGKLEVFRRAEEDGIEFKE